MTSETLLVLPDNGGEAERAAVGSADRRTEVNHFFDATERLFELNRTAVKTSIDEQCVVALKALEERSPLGAWRLQASYVFAGSAKAVAYWRHASEILLDSFADAVSDAEHRVNRGFLVMTGAMEDASVGLGSSILMGDPGPATQSMEETAQIISQPEDETPARRRGRADGQSASK
ncbi:phasin family protein [Paraburkholderia sp. CNPSo 3155]|uniref:TIGR01841 family phasin n=1 Tax=Paraburkholderia atlantica TaxID=2654982 RepID=UPI00128BA099|nr:TIGR01841 family phasin [Paraburkholderia atlantica]MBB5414299.1 phasin family protein [Paraburkholderia atlantica]MPW10011.1 phasin family protein [Paraburkholderia atlantica]NUY34364.1 phasin family protein [Paraburkholderia atlantica]